MQLVIVVNLGEYLGTELVVVGDLFEGIKLVTSSRHSQQTYLIDVDIIGNQDK